MQDNNKLVTNYTKQYTEYRQFKMPNTKLYQQIITLHSANANSETQQIKNRLKVLSTTIKSAAKKSQLILKNKHKNGKL